MFSLHAIISFFLLHTLVCIDFVLQSLPGVYVAAVRDVTLEDRLQIGDQILEVNGHTTGTCYALREIHPIFQPH